MESTALFVAAHFGLVDIATILIKPPISVDINSAIFGCTPLYVSASEGYKEFVHLMLEMKGINVDPVDREEGLDTPFIEATSHGHEAIVLLLLNHGQDIEARTHDGQTALSKAAERGNDSILRLPLGKRRKYSLKRKRRKNTIFICCSLRKYSNSNFLTRKRCGYRISR
jgi:ankyrin repeat protein